MELLNDLLKGFTPDGGTWGSEHWTTEITGEAGAEAVAGTKKQHTKLTVDHHVWVCFADAATKPSYYVLHHMEVEASANTGDLPPLSDDKDARGFFNSSVRVAYRGGKPSVTTAGCTVTKAGITPSKSAKDDFDAILDRLQIEMVARTPSGTGPVVFSPTFQARNHLDKWSLSVGDLASWEIHQREPWSALGVDGPEGAQTNVPVPPQWVRQFFDGAFGRISEMASASFAPVGVELLGVWKVDGPFTKTSRVATLKIDVDYRHRVNLFHNGNIGTDGEPRRVCAEMSRTNESKELSLHTIAVKHE